MKADKIIGAVQGVTKKWSKQRKREERESSAQANRRYMMTRRYHVSIREAAWEVMEQAYMKASANGTLPAHARQIMYAARGPIDSLADRHLGGDFDKYFTQTLLPDYIEEKGVDWNVVFDARGHFREPHTDEEIPLGTLQVRNYLNRVENHEVDEIDFNIREKHYPTLGPKNAFGAILFVEKEGFMPLFEAVNLSDRYDIAIMSSKGMSTTASRELVDWLGGDNEIPILVLHDFDKAGFSIVGTLSRDNRRYSFTHNPNVIDLGLRLDDIEGLPSESVYGRQSARGSRWTLSENGATDAEIDFLMESRVELNAFSSDGLIAFIERKLKEHGIAKVVPDDETLTDAYKRMRRQAVIQERINEALAELEQEEEEAPPAPADLRARIEADQKINPEKRWDEVIWTIAEHDHDDEGGAP
jgi:Topoisomerase 6 subunit A/Spo11, Toprim domain